MSTMNTLHTEQAPIPLARPSAPAAVLPDSNVQPISEAQFAALVRRFEVAETGEDLVYTKDDQPWEFRRTGPYLIVTHRTLPLAQRYYEIV